MQNITLIIQIYRILCNSLFSGRNCSAKPAFRGSGFRLRSCGQAAPPLQSGVGFSVYRVCASAEMTAWAKKTARQNHRTAPTEHFIKQFPIVKEYADFRCQSADRQYRQLHTACEYEDCNL